MVNDQTLLSKWQLTEQELTIIVQENPSLRGMMIGYVAEYKLRALLTANPHVTGLLKPDDHDRKKGNKNDLIITYRDRPFSFEVKSLQTNSIRHNPIIDVYTGRVQVDASDGGLLFSLMALAWRPPVYSVVSSMYLL